MTKSKSKYFHNKNNLLRNWRNSKWRSN